MRCWRIPEALWDAENANKPNRFGALDATRHIVFRFVSNFRDWRNSYERPLWESGSRCSSRCCAATAAYGYSRGAFPRVMLARMAPAASSTRTATRTRPPNGRTRSNPAANERPVTFFVDGAAYHLAEGEAVEVNNMGVHAVENRGTTDRVHLIFEYYDIEQPEPAWLPQLLAAAR